jgi:cytoskeletal protein CcmA (bactofilin family)
MTKKLSLVGSSKQREPIRTDRITAQGHHYFYATVEADSAEITGSCIMDNTALFKTLKSDGHLRVDRAEIDSLAVTGSINATHLTVKNMRVHGIIQAQCLKVRYGQIIMKGICRIGRINSVTIEVSKGFALKKRLICEEITGKTVVLIHTKANIVRGNDVFIGEHCEIETLFYQHQYTIAHTATVKQIVKETLQ